MARAKKTIETPGQETAQPQDGVSEALTPELTDPTANPEATALAGRNAILATLNEQGAAIIARFEEYAFTDIIGHPLTDCIDFLELVKAASMPVLTLTDAGFVTNEEGKKQPAPGKPVLTEHGWHVPG